MLKSTRFSSIHQRRYQHYCSHYYKRFYPKIDSYQFHEKQKYQLKQISKHQKRYHQYDVAIIGGGISGMSTAARLASRGVSRTVVLEQHDKIGGCCGFWEPSITQHNNSHLSSPFSFDVGATTLVDFEQGGVGGELLNSIGLSPLTSDNADMLSGYCWWPPPSYITTTTSSSSLSSISSNSSDGNNLPNGKPYLALYRDKEKFEQERIAVFGDTPGVHQFWRLMDMLASIFWNAARRGIKLPLQNINDLSTAVSILWPLFENGQDELSKSNEGLQTSSFSRTSSNSKLSDWWERFMTPRYIYWSVEDALRYCGVQDNILLRGFLRCLIEDTVNSRDLSQAPLINSALGISIRAAGISRHHGGYKGFWDRFISHYVENLSGEIQSNTSVSKIHYQPDTETFKLDIRKKEKNGKKWQKSSFESKRVVSALPVENTMKIYSDDDGDLKKRLMPYIQRDEHRMGGGIVVFLGVPQEEVQGHEPFTHHQLLQDNDQPLGNGNNMFISVSSEDDTQSAPLGYRSVMLSTHCETDPWISGISSKQEYLQQKQNIIQQLLKYARRVYPDLGKNAVIMETGTPRSYYRFTKRKHGQVGGPRLSLDNSNFHAVPQDIFNISSGKSNKGLWLAGDGTWPGLGTVAAVVGSRIVSNSIWNDIQRRGYTTYNRSDSSLNYRRNRRIPTMKNRLPIVGNAWQFLKQPDRIHQTLEKIARKYTSEKVIQLELGPNNTHFFVTDSKLAKQLLLGEKRHSISDRTSFPIVDYSYARFCQNTVDLNGRIPRNIGGVTFANGDQWKTNRKSALKCLFHEQFRTKGIHVTNQCVDSVMEQWNKMSSSKHGKPIVDMDKWMSRLAIDVMGFLAYDTDLKTIQTEKEHHKLSSAVHDMLHGIQNYLYHPWSPEFYKIWKSPSILRLDRAIDYLETIGKELAESRLSNPKEIGKHGDMLDFLLGRFFLSQNHEKINSLNNIEEKQQKQQYQEKYPEEWLHMQTTIMDILGAGHDTTANLMKFAIGMLALHPEIQEKARKEVNQVLNNNIDITQQHLSKLKYTESVIKETLRLYPLGIAFSRVATQDLMIEVDNDKDGDYYYIPRNSALLISPYAAGRDPKCWDPQTFNRFQPERFLNIENNNSNNNFNENNVEEDRSGWFPFGGGVRGCIGAQFGVDEAKVVLAKILSQWRFTSYQSNNNNNDSNNLMDSKLSFTLRPRYPVLLQLEHLENNNCTNNNNKIK